MLTELSVEELGKRLGKEPQAVERMIARGDLSRGGLAPELLGIPDVAVRLSCTISAVRKLIGRGELPAMQLSPRRTRIPAEALEKYKAGKLGTG